MDITVFFAVIIAYFAYDLLDMIFYTSVPCVVVNDKGKDVLTLVQVKRKYRKQISKKLNLNSDMEID